MVFMKKILHFGTFDINNYGDLLFPLIAKRELKDLTALNMRAVSPVGGMFNDLSDAMQCVGLLDSMDEIETVDGVLIGGGNIIHALPTENKAYVSAGRECFAYSDLWIAPAFLFRQHVSIVWNAPGVPGPFSKAQHSLVTHALMRTNYLSVRDEESKKYLQDVWSDAEIAVVPDSAWRINSLWNQTELKTAYDALLARLNVTLPDRSIVFHLDQRHLGRQLGQKIAKQLDDIARQSDAQPILIALAPCYGDGILVREIGAMMSSRPIILHSPQSLREIVACIAFASLYVGSSMHGLITAAAFGVPGVGVAQRSMAKFSGLVTLTKMPDIVVEDWDQAMDVLKNMDVEKRKIELHALQEKLHCVLDEHWDRIRLELKTLHPRSAELNAINATRTWRNMMNYQNKAMSAIRAMEKAEQKLIHEKEIAGLLKDRNAALFVESTLSWRITRPLRIVSKKFPSIRVAFLKIFTRLNLAEPASAELSVPQDMAQKITAYQSTFSKNKKKIVLYTAIFGDYDSLVLPEMPDADVDYVCFTDCPKNNYGIWQIQASPYYHSDPVRVARYIKTHPHQLFPDHEIAIWLDGNVVLRGDVKQYISMLDNKKVSLGFIPHPLRDCFYQEAAACLLLGKDDSSVIDAQMATYLKNGLKEHAGLFETNFMIIHLKDDAVFAMFRVWWQQINIFSRRDQLGLAWALHQNPVPLVDLLTKGISVREHVDFKYYTHQQSRQFFVPTNIQKLGQVKSPFDDVSFINLKEARLSQVRSKSIDIVICVYNALEDVQLCLQSVRQHLLPLHKIFIINDCSDQPTTEYLRNFSVNDKQIVLIENETNLGYVQSANRGLAMTAAEFCIMLNSDTIVSENWALKLLDVAVQNPEVGIVSPLSNAAGVQSLPDIKSGNNNTAINIIPEGVDIADVDCFLETVSLAYKVPYVILAHGFCFGIKREVINRIGLFDAVNFTRYYGEENDYCFRASAAGFHSAIATNTFVYHRKSRSISEEERIIHMGESGQKLRDIYGADVIRNACIQGRDHPLLKRIRVLCAAFYKKKPHKVKLKKSI